MSKETMKRLFSIPGSRWRGRIKQFERDVYDNWADAIDRSIWASWCDRWVESFSREVPDGSAILDVGCGTGRALLILGRRRPALLAGFDISPRAIDVARDRLRGLDADLRVGDAEASLPWPDGTFDAVTMTATIHHFPHPEKVIGNVFRVLKPDGRLIIAEPYFFFPILQMENLLMRIYPLNGDLRFFSRRGLRRLVESCGFQTVAQRRAAILAWYIVARKGGAVP